MMPENTDRNRKKRGSIISAAVVAGYMLALVALVAWSMGLVGAETDTGFATFSVLLYAVIGGAVVIGVLKALRERLREIDGGEEDEAKKY
jgi:uncharacterized membrane protein YeaQ/YmgE (transglycosylase-associated protein family)